MFLMSNKYRIYTNIGFKNTELETLGFLALLDFLNCGLCG